MKKSIILIVFMFLLLISGCSSTGQSKLNTSSNSGTVERIKIPEKQFLNVLYTKDAGQVEFNQFLVNLGTIDSLDKKKQAEAKYVSITRKTLNSLQKLNPSDQEVKLYLDSLIKLAISLKQLDEANLKLAKEYERNKKLSTAYMQQYDSLKNRIQQEYSSAMQKEINLTQRFALSARNHLKDFMYSQSILNNELIEMNILQQKLNTTKVDKSSNYYDKNIKPALIKITKDTINALKEIHSSDPQLSEYVNKLIEFYELKLKISEKEKQIISEQTKGKFSQATANLFKRYELLDFQTTQMRIDLIRKFIK